MKLSYVFIYQAVVALLFGLVGLLVPTTLGSVYGASLDEVAQTLARYFGAALTTIGLISWFVRNAPESSERLWIVRSLALGSLLGLIPAVLAITNNLVNQLGWVNIALAVIAVIGFGYFGFVKTTASEAMAAR